MATRKKNRKYLNLRLYFILAGIFLFFALSSVIGIVFYDTGADDQAQIMHEYEAAVTHLNELKELNRSTLNSMEVWLLIRNGKLLDEEKTPIWNKKRFESLDVKLTLAANHAESPVFKEKLKILFGEKIRRFNNVFVRFMNEVQTPAQLLEEKPYNRALEIYADDAVIIAKEIDLLIDELVNERIARITFIKNRVAEDRNNFQTISLLAIFIFFGLVLVIGNYLIQIIIRPIYAINHFASQIVEGDYPEGQLSAPTNELGALSIRLNQLNNNLKKARDFSNKLSQGKFDLPEDYFDERDELGRSLVQVQAKMHELFEEEVRRNWTIAGFARFGDVLRQTTDLKLLTEDIIVNLARYVKANLGALFLLNDETPSEPYLEMIASYAYNKRKFTHQTFKIGEGPVGQAASSLETIHITQIPENYVILTSGLGEAPPSSLLIVPLISSNNLYGVIELASFNRFRPDEIEFVKKLGENIAAVISSIKGNERTLKLLEQARSMSSELTKKSEALEKNAMVMTQAQSELENANRQMETQMRKINQTAIELSQSEKRFYSMLENASEIITIFEKDASVRFQSPSVLRILGYRPEELPNFFRYVHHEDLYKVKEFFTNLLHHPDSEFSIEYRYLRKDGALVHLESVGKNLIQDESINGIVTNTRDITERIKADLNTQRRMMFQSLSENSPDLIIRFNQNGKYIYINPSIERYTGNIPAYYLDQTIFNVGMLDQEIRFWEYWIKLATETKEKSRTEAVFPSTMGDRNMQVEIIPEFNIDNEVESILFISHDITELKQAESKILAQNQNLEFINSDLSAKKAEIEEINKDITESIQYAKRIQESIIPGIAALENVLKNIFILYKPRDIVSGDFYWFSQRGNKIFLAVVDCTGHGVPGAFMSLIGYNLLNQIVNEQEIYEPAAILDELHERVVTSLKQNEKSMAKDGMDIAICRIELDKKIMQFAGANRPLYWWHQYELNVVKGDKYGVGSDNPPPFTNHSLQIETGDSIYLFSDGFVDQFGGERGKKFSPKRLRELLVRNQHKTLPEQQKVIEKTFQEWKGEQAQVDDIVMLGIRF